MARTARATPSLEINYTLSSSTTDSTVSESATAGYTTLNFGNGTGYGQVNQGVTKTGTLKYQDAIFDFRSFPKTVFDSTININFASKISPTHVNQDPHRGVKGILVTNTWTHPSGALPSGFQTSQIPYLTVAATGDYAFDALFNGESGNIKVMPSSTWAFTDFIGVSPKKTLLGNPSGNELVLIDSGSGVTYEIVVVGVSEDD